MGTEKVDHNDTLGRPTVYPGKRRDKPVQVALTDEGLEALAIGCNRTGHNKANYIEKLLREEKKRQGWIVTARDREGL